MNRRLAPTGMAAARQAAWLFALSGALAFVAAPVEPHRAVALVALGLADAAAAAVVALTPWHRWSPRATLAVVPAALTIMAGAHALGLVPVRSYGVFFVLLFAWIGIHHPPATAPKLVPLIAIGYAVPIVATDARPPLDPRSLVLAMTVGVLVAETIARGVASGIAARLRAERAAHSFATISRATSQLVELDADQVLDAVVDAVMSLGYDGANLAVIDHPTNSFLPDHARGLATSFAGQRFPASAGMTGRVIAAGAPVVIEDYQSLADAMPAIRASGARTTVGVPIGSNGQLVAVLIASYGHTRPVEAEDVEALRVIASHAGAALNALGRLAAEQARSATHAQASLTDELTGLANRRHASDLLAGLRPGDGVVLIDVDRFKTVNDTRGHPDGDQLLRDLAAFLATNVRDRDHVVRYGGEEFLLVLPDTQVTGAVQLVDRLRQQWHATAPLATFSAGAAVHDARRPPAATVEDADRALYRAKDAGRNRVCAAEAGRDPSSRALAS